MFSLFPSSPSKQTKPVEALSRSFFSHLVKLETLFHSKQYTLFSLDELIQNYAKAVEYYDNAGDDISYYFIFKIQDCLATQRTLKLLMDQKNKEEQMLKRNLLSPLGGNTPGTSSTQNKGKTKISFPSIHDVSDSKDHLMPDMEIGEISDEDEGLDVCVIKDDFDTEFKQKKKAYMTRRISKNNQASFSVMKNQQQKFVNFFYKLENEKAQQTQDMTTILGEHGDSANTNDETIKNDVSKQRDRIKARLEQRKHQSFMNQSQNSDIVSGHGLSTNNEALTARELTSGNTANLLKELETSENDNNTEIGNINTLGTEPDHTSLVEVDEGAKPDIQFDGEEHHEKGEDGAHKKELDSFGGEGSLDLSPIAITNSNPTHRRFRKKVDLEAISQTVEAESDKQPEQDSEKPIEEA